MKTPCIGTAFIVIAALFFPAAVRAELYINEICFDSPKDTDTIGEYIELRGTPEMSLSDHFLIFLENENTATNTGNPGHVEAMFDLGAYSLGSNGFLTLRQKNTLYTGDLAPAPGTTDLINTGGATYSGWGSGATSTIGASQEGNGGVIENSGFTAMLIHNTGDASYAPMLGQDLDQNNDGLDPIDSDVNDWRSNWTILDSIGIHSEEGEAAYGRLYGAINFGPEATTQIEPDAIYIGLDMEIEVVARWGDSVGSTEADWHATNVTDKAVSGYTGGGDYRQSGDPHPVGGVFAPNFKLESSQGVPYGTPLCTTLGATNYSMIPGDTNGDNQVDEDDAAVVASHWGTSVTNRANQGDFNRDGAVDATDAAILAANWGDWTTGEAAATVPEPTAMALILGGLLAPLFGSRRRAGINQR
ncbi:MAG: hypothetical protein JW719_03935 [Pirellulales bacterium]|nr:hypothetical protein [Pirellulales bacterium]